MQHLCRGGRAGTPCGECPCPSAELEMMTGALGPTPWADAATSYHPASASVSLHLADPETRGNTPSSAQATAQAQAAAQARRATDEAVEHVHTCVWVSDVDTLHGAAAKVTTQAEGGSAKVSLAST